MVVANSSEVCQPLVFCAPIGPLLSGRTEKTLIEERVESDGFEFGAYKRAINTEKS